MIESIVGDDQTIIAIILRGDAPVDGIQFLTPDSFSLQLGHMGRPAGYRVPPHIHGPAERQTVGTQEVLIVKRGRIRIDLYSPEQRLVASRDLTAGDLVLIAGGGHGIEVLEEATIVEIKNGPYVEGADKGQFHGRE